MMLLALLVALCLGDASTRCKRAVSIFPNKSETCGSNENCFDCLETPGCGWCGGSHCGTTGEGCFNATLHDVKSARHGDEGPICSAPEDEWIGHARNCNYCKQYSQGCDRCLTAPLRPWRLPNATCGWCKEGAGNVGRCDRGTPEGGPLYVPCAGEWRTSEERRADEGQCSDHVKCASLSSCPLCVTSFAALRVACTWCSSRGCLDPRDGNSSCATPLILHSLLPFDVCPASAATSPPPIHPNMQMHRQFNLVSSTIALALCLLLYFVHKLLL